MLQRTSLLALFVALVAAASSPAQIVIVDEDFESYNNSSEVFAVWGGTAGSQNYAQLVDETYEQIIDDTFEFSEVGSRAFPNGGQGLEHTGGLLPSQGGVFADNFVEFTNLNGGVPIVPTESQAVEVEVDIYNIGNIVNRITLGLRSNAPANLVEIGHYNAASSPSGLPTFVSARTTLFDSYGGEGTAPNWVDFDLPEELDTGENGTTLGDLGEDWHTFKATISNTSILYQVDLLRDGIDARTGEAGYDAELEYEIGLNAAGFDSLRLGSPSGIGSTGNGTYSGVIFDNVKLSLIDIDAPLPDGDYNGDGVVDAADYTVWRDTLDSLEDLRADGNGNGVVDGPAAGAGNDYEVWATNHGASTGGVSLSVPEPASALLALAALAVGAARRR